MGDFERSSLETMTRALIGLALACCVASFPADPTVPKTAQEEIIGRISADMPSDPTSETQFETIFNEMTSLYPLPTNHDTQHMAEEMELAHRNDNTDAKAAVYHTILHLDQLRKKREEEPAWTADEDPTDDPTAEDPTSDPTDRGRTFAPVKAADPTSLTGDDEVPSKVVFEHVRALHKKHRSKHTTQKELDPTKQHSLVALKTKYPNLSNEADLEKGKQTESSIERSLRKVEADARQQQKLIRDSKAKLKYQRKAEREARRAAHAAAARVEALASSIMAKKKVSDAKKTAAEASKAHHAKRSTAAVADVGHRQSQVRTDAPRFSVKNARKKQKKAQKIKHAALAALAKATALSKVASQLSKISAKKKSHKKTTKAHKKKTFAFDDPFAPLPKKEKDKFNWVPPTEWQAFLLH